MPNAKPLFDRPLPGVKRVELNLGRVGAIGARHVVTKKQANVELDLDEVTLKIHRRPDTRGVGNKRLYDFVSVANAPYSIFLHYAHPRLGRCRKDSFFVECSDHLYRRR